MIPGQRIDNIELLRGAAALAVAWYHFTNGGNLVPKGSWLQSSGQFGYLGVEVFFVISGFVIPYAMYNRGYKFRRDASSFIIRRIIRLEPAYLLSVVINVALWSATAALLPATTLPMPDNMGAVTLAHVAYIAPWLNIPWLSPVYWSLSIEFQYYIFIVVMAPMLLARNPWWIRAFFAIISVLSLLSTDSRSLGYYLPLFGLGFISFVRTTRHLKGPEIICLLIAMSLLALSNLGLPAACAGLLSAFIIAVPQLRVPLPFIFFGTISYSMYLIHVPVGGRVINLATRLPNTGYREVLGLGLAMIVSIGVAYIFYRLVERPTAHYSQNLRGSAAWSHRWAESEPRAP